MGNVVLQKHLDEKIIFWQMVQPDAPEAIYQIAVVTSHAEMLSSALVLAGELRKRRGCLRNRVI